MRDSLEPEDLRRIAVRVASEAAALLRDHACIDSYSARVQGETIVADKVSEEYIIDALRYEGLRLVGVSEERGFFEVNGGGGLRAVIDPLDGSNNYALCIPWASVSIAFTYGEKLRDVVAGAVVPVFELEPFSFAIGKGCFYGGRRVDSRSVIRGDQRQSRTVVVYLDEDKPEVAVNLLSAIRSHLGAVKVRGLGSAALELCYTALGRFAVFADLRERLRNVDVAAALGFLREAGGEAYTLKGEPLDSPLDRVVSLSGVIASLDLDLARRLGGVVTRVGMR